MHQTFSPYINILFSELKNLICTWNHIIRCSCQLIPSKCKNIFRFYLIIAYNRRYKISSELNRRFGVINEDVYHSLSENCQRFDGTWLCEAIPCNSNLDYRDERGCLVTHEVCSIHVHVTWCIRMMPGSRLPAAISRRATVWWNSKGAHSTRRVHPAGINVSTLRHVRAIRYACKNANGRLIFISLQCAWRIYSHFFAAAC